MVDTHDLTRFHFRFFGRVQGVGFRFRASHIAKSLGLTGWVHNEDDGSVSCDVQGSSDSINMFLQELAQQPFIEISYIEKNVLSVHPDEHDFRTEY